MAQDFLKSIGHFLKPNETDDDEVNSIVEHPNGRAKIPIYKYFFLHIDVQKLAFHQVPTSSQAALYLCNLPNVGLPDVAMISIEDDAKFFQERRIRPIAIAYVDHSRANKLLDNEAVVVPFCF